MEIIQALLFARQLLALLSAIGTIGAEKVEPVITEGNRRLDIMVQNNAGPTDDDKQWIKGVRHTFVDHIEEVAALDVD